jgi:hypothetical protein
MSLTVKEQPTGHTTIYYQGRFGEAPKSDLSGTTKCDHARSIDCYKFGHTLMLYSSVGLNL